MQTMFQRINFIFWLTPVTGLMAALVASIGVSLMLSGLAGLYHQVKTVEDETDVISPA
ncbi:MAG: ABC-type nickel/cobalt efflux system permease component RcnA [Planctomycetaceae bacterium]|jgi:ABC-type nickel/cobalt efflux system permease component RcnA